MHLELHMQIYELFRLYGLKICCPDANPSSQPNRSLLGIASVKPCLTGLCHCTFFVYHLPLYLLYPLKLIGFPWRDNLRESDELTFLTGWTHLPYLPLQDSQQLIPRVTYEFSDGEQPNRTQQSLLPQVSSFS